MLYFRAHVYLMSIFWRHKSSKMNALPVDPYLRLVFTAGVFTHAKKAVSAIFAFPFPILVIFLSRYIPKIRKRIITAIPVNMIYMMYRPFPSNVQPSQSMGSVQSSINTDLRISSPVNPARNTPGNSSLAKGNSPSKYSGIFVIIKYIAQFVCGNSDRIHDDPFIVSRQTPTIWGKTIIVDNYTMGAELNVTPTGS